MASSLLDRIRKTAARVGPAGAATDALNGAVQQADRAAYDADEKKYGPRIADAEQKKRAAAAARSRR